MSAKRSPWFDGQKPARPGIYNASICRDPRYYRYWNGKWWAMGAKSPDKAFALRETKSVVNWHGYTMSWRGLASKP